MLNNDYSLPYGIGFQDPANDAMLALIDLHDNIIFYLIILFVLIIWLYISALNNRKDHLAYLEHGNLIEVIWTITPAVVLWAIGIPSLKLLYMMDEIIDPELTVKAIGSQWFWSYEYSDYSNNIAFDSYLIGSDELTEGQFRQLDVDLPLVLPINTSIRLLVSSNDVIHSYAIPSLAIKCDALPGRINSIGLTISRPSIFYGQCSELCGVMHAFMPCVIKAVNLPEFINFVRTSLDEA